MILAFLLGGMFQLFRLDKRIWGNYPSVEKLRKILYQVVIAYLLFKIGFKGGKSVLSESLDHVVFTSVIAIVGAVIWTVFLLRILRSWSPFDRLTQVSIATHFGSVSVGTFIAGLEFLHALGIDPPSSVVVWLAIMEIPAIFVGVFALKIKLAHMLQILKKDTSLWILVGSMLLGMFGSEVFSADVYTFLFSTIFLPILAYFLFEMGCKASASLSDMKGKLKALCGFGILIPLVGGIFGVSVGGLLGYGMGEMFVFAILMASASYVLVPISLREILRSAQVTTPKAAENAIATSMALSVGITLPFNIIVGFELYYLFLKFAPPYTPVLWRGVLLPFVIWGVAIMRPLSKHQ